MGPKAFCPALSILVLLAALSVADESSAEESEWGLGIGLGGIYYPHYIGADQSDLLVAPFPYVEYYGERFRIDDDGIAAELFDSERFNLSISMNSALPVNDSDNDARAGMDDLNLIIEAGPVLETTINEWETGELRLDLPLRAATEIDFSKIPVYAGWTFDPKLHLEIHQDNRTLEWQIGALFGSEKFNDIFYEVSAEDATLDRPQYEAKAGLVGWRTSLGTKIRRGNWRYFGYVRYISLQDSANDASPLVRSNDYWSAGIGLAWMFQQPENQN